MEHFNNLVSRNDVLSINPTVADIDITTGASSWLWAVFAIMVFTMLITMGWAFTIPPGQRTFHYLTIAILGTASVAYFSLAADLGATAIPVEYLHGDTNPRATRSIWYVRYIDWVITTPLLLLELLLVSGLPLSAIFGTVFADEVMIITGLVGALVPSTYKWGYFTFGNVAMFGVFYVLYGPGLASARRHGGEIKKTYVTGAAILSFLWFCYPIAWGLCDGSNTISPAGEMVFYGVLDILAKPVFAMIHLFSMRKVDYAALGLQSGKATDFPDTEKAGAHSSGVGAGTLKTAEANGNHSPEATVAGHQ
ncbi:family A G protein-coupled receptor-like protein [Ceraceosorus guamensis]|uniref:Family A G protein-coupled receptor-like protein n=1 Tax=Ceraceosorus guamensis TaxID=1522189 RepID=A0A316VYM7_9BASI|nr:family A G protein-coupled receptor-like protein [Ceraceosorus guamensis]PWN42434.1 family A G protein-coupled receptor-like protein [Ceraceosorus guamensis]